MITDIKERVIGFLVILAFIIPPYNIIMWIIGYCLYSHAKKTGMNDASGDMALRLVLGAPATLPFLTWQWFKKKFFK